MGLIVLRLLPIIDIVEAVVRSVQTVRFVLAVLVNRSVFKAKPSAVALV